MKTKDIERLFPKKCLITKEMIDSRISIGTQLLRSFLPEEVHEDIFWGLSIGQVGGVKIKTEVEIVYNGRKMLVPLYLDSSITEPTEITFTLR